MASRKDMDVVRARSKSRHDRRQLVLSMVKTTAGCADCGYDSHPAALDFDHVHGVKTGNIAHLWGSAWDRIWSEVNKCEVVCANCHRIRTVRRRALQKDAA